MLKKLVQYTYNSYVTTIKKQRQTTTKKAKTEEYKLRNG